MELEALVESLLFVADQAVTPGQLAKALEAEEVAVEEALSALDAGYLEGGRGLNRLHFERGEEGYVALDWSERMDVALEKKRALRHEQVERWQARQAAEGGAE